MVSVRLISRGTSAIVTAHSTYFSGGSIFFCIMLGITLVADVITISSYDVAAVNPFTAYIAAMCVMDVSASAMRTSQQFLIRRRVQSMSFDQYCCLFEQRAAIAQELKGFADRLENADDLNRAIHELIVDTLKKHSRIIFNGNGYDEAWIKEAEQRGLSNYRSTPEALAHYLDEKNVNVFTDNQVLSENELHSRYEIYLEKYYKTINIEALTMIDMLKKDILPACQVYEKRLCDIVTEMQKLTLPLRDSYELQTLIRIMEREKEIHADLQKMEELLNERDGATNLDTAFFYRERIIPLMEAIRRNTDVLEQITARDCWPMPSYLDLLFGID